MTGKAVTDAGPAGAGLLYDARRGVCYARRVLRGWLHLLCFWASLAGGALLLAGAHGGAHVTAAAVYSASLSALFGTSALYHRGAWTGAWRLRLRRLDQAMIFFLIAGTATPAFLLSAPAGAGLACLGGLALPWVWIHAGAASGVLLLAGGLLYIAGALSYHRRWPDPYPSVFGYHEVFHVYVCAAAACQYAAIARLAG